MLILPALCSHFNSTKWLTKCSYNLTGSLNKVCVPHPHPQPHSCFLLDSKQGTSMKALAWVYLELGLLSTELFLQWLDISLPRLPTDRFPPLPYSSSASKRYFILRLPLLIWKEVDSCFLIVQIIPEKLPRKKRGIINTKLGVYHLSCFWGIDTIPASRVCSCSRRDQHWSLFQYSLFTPLCSPSFTEPCV